MKRYLPVLVFILFLSQSCISGITKNEIFQNDKIDPGIRAAIAELDKQVYKNMCENNYEALSRFFSDSLMETMNTDFAQKFMPQIQKVIKDKHYRIFDEFYIKHVKPMDTVKISSGNGDNAYAIKFIAPYRESCLSMIVAGDSLNEVMLTLLYSNIKGKWKLSSLKGEDYSLKGRNAIDQYHYAINLEKNGYLVDAENIMALANHCNTPAGTIFNYSNAEEMKRFSDSLMNETKLLLPYTINEMITKPRVLNIYFEVMDHKFVPMVVYQSSVNVSDTIELKKENDAMQKKMGNIFNGIDKNNSVILYRAYNDLPDGRNNPPYYGYIQRIK